MSDFKAIVQGITRLKPISKTLHRILEMSRDPDVDLTELADMVATDPVLTANLLKDANSAYYGRSNRFETVHQAVMFLGTGKVFDLVLMAGCRDNLAKAQDGYDLEAGELWKYSLSSALLARSVAQKTGSMDPQFVFTVAMLKDIGKIVLSQHVSEQYERIRLLVDGGGHSFREAEKAVLGIDHAELGAMVAQVWQFSPKMVDMIRHHHHPLACSNALHEAAAVYMGDLLCMVLGTGVGADGLAYRFQQPVIELLGLSDTDLQLLLVEFQSQREGLSDLFAA